MHATLRDRVAQGADDVLLPDDVCERAGAMTAVQRSGQGSVESSGATSGLALRAALGIPLGALLAWALVGAGFLNYDTAYSLLWGGDLAHGRAPDFSVPLAPTPHPLATLTGIVLTPFGDAAQPIWVVLAFLALGALGWLSYELGAHWFGPAAGAVAALVILTRLPVLSFGVRAYVDIPYAALVLGAILAEARSPGRRRAADPARAGRPAAARGVAVLVRLRRVEAGPAAAPAGRRRARPVAGPRPDRHRRLAPLADRHAHQRGDAAADHRPRRRPDHDAAPARRDPARAGAARRGGGRDPGAGVHAPARGAARGRRVPVDRRVLRAGRRGPADPHALSDRAGRDPGRVLRRRRVRLAADAARPPVAAAVGDDRRRRPRRRSWCSRRARSTGSAICATRWGSSPRSSSDLHSMSEHIRCEPVGVPNHRPVPHVALWADLPPGEIVSAQLEQITEGVYLQPASERVLRNFTLDPNDPKRLTAAVPPGGFELVLRNESWLLYSTCHSTTARPDDRAAAATWARRRRSPARAGPVARSRRPAPPRRAR